jgi:hypothetical protein
MRLIHPYFLPSSGAQQVGGRRVVSGFNEIRKGLHWRDAPAAYVTGMMIYNRFIL